MDDPQPPELVALAISTRFPRTWAALDQRNGLAWRPEERGGAEWGWTRISDEEIRAVLEAWPESPVPPMMAACGGCLGLGSHKRWCPAVVGHYASIIGLGAEALHSIGDTIGPNDMGLSNQAWSLAGRLAGYARESSR